MCGIAGIFGPARDGCRHIVERMLVAMAHRGPDDWGTQEFRDARSDASLVLGNRRLAVIDLSAAGHQPMQDQATGNALVFNGAVFNFVDLKRRMAGKVERYFSDTDTEAILYSYGVYGRACVEQWRGMFAVAIWDARRHELFLVRDRLGIKPLYWYAAPGGDFVFASEVRALVASGCVPAIGDPGGLDSFLAYGAVQAPWTIIAGVQSLLPGHYLVVRDGRVVEEEPYWEPSPGARPPAEASRARIVDQTKEQLVEAVDMCLVSDAPLGAFLSGGIDSTAMVALMCRARKTPVKTFSVVFEEEQFSEVEYSRLVARKWATDHQEIVLTATDVLGMLPRVIAAMDQPTIDGVNTYVISKAARGCGATVALSGLGGDEVFGGYSTFRQLALFKRLAEAESLFPTWLRSSVAGVVRMALRTSTTADKMAELIRQPTDMVRAFLLLRTLFLPETRERLKPGGRVGSPDGVGVDEEVLTRLRQRLKGLDIFEQVSILELSSYTGNMLLRDADVMSMAHSLEVRVPFLDHLLFEYVARLPARMKTKVFTPKALLVAAMGDDLPPEIVRRRKMGFTLPWEKWFRGALKDKLEEAFVSLSDSRNPPISPGAARAIWAEFKADRGRVTWSRVWALYVLVKWWDRMALA